MKATDVPLGAKARDRVSGFEGIIECRGEWLNGCIRITLAPTDLDKDGALKKTATFDIEQIELLDEGAVIVAPKPMERRTNGPMPSPVRGH